MDSRFSTISFLKASHHWFDGDQRFISWMHRSNTYPFGSHIVGFLLPLLATRYSGLNGVVFGSLSLHTDRSCSFQLRGGYEKLGMLLVFDCSFSETQALLQLLMPLVVHFLLTSLHLMSHWGTFIWIVKITPIFRGSEASHNQSFIEIACNNEYLWFGYNAFAPSKRHEREITCLYRCFSLKCYSKFSFISTGLFAKVAVFL